MPLRKFAAAIACGMLQLLSFLSGINICATHFLISPPLSPPPCCKECGKFLLPRCTSSSLGISALVVSPLPPDTVSVAETADGQCGCCTCAPSASQQELEMNGMSLQPEISRLLWTVACACARVCVLNLLLCAFFFIIERENLDVPFKKRGESYTHFLVF